MVYNRTAEISLGLGIISMMLSVMVWIVVESGLQFGGSPHSLLEITPLIAGLPFAICGVCFGGADKKDVLLGEPVA